MFDDDDAENLVNAEIRIPDGIIDGTQYAEIFARLVRYMKEINPESYVSNITWIMKTMNECYEDSTDENGSEIVKSRATDTITALSYFVMTLIASLGEEAFAEYIRIQEEEVIPDLFDNASTIPFYDINKEVNGLLEFFDEIDQLGDDEIDD